MYVNNHIIIIAMIIFLMNYVTIVHNYNIMQCTILFYATMYYAMLYGSFRLDCLPILNVVIYALFNSTFFTNNPKMIIVFFYMNI